MREIKKRDAIGIGKGFFSFLVSLIMLGSCSSLPRLDHTALPEPQSSFPSHMDFHSPEARELMEIMENSGVGESGHLSQKIRQVGKGYGNIDRKRTDPAELVELKFQYLF